MVTTPQIQPISFEDFLEWYPDNGKSYELIEGVIVEMLPTGSPEDISGFLIAELNLEIRKQNLSYSIPKNCLLKPLAPRSGYLPDVAVINREYVKNEPLWEKSSVIQNGQTIPFVIEVVSTNWRDDYGHKFVEYEAMGIVEYWIVDYHALGAVRYIGKPKQPTITICQLIEGEYQMEKYVKGDRLKSSIFPELELTTDAIFQAAE
ncbi:Uma2 family endonuclease [Crocosphaera chwakensis]|uniref:Uma2 family endonuclease n=1 Tax=Crocosphaera chwakensis TaxID=2546361 RepID=UPI00031CD455|nr:Uma2 family endonuclease [Crocosphaera chwakensis]